MAFEGLLYVVHAYISLSITVKRKCNDGCEMLSTVPGM